MERGNRERGTAGRLQERNEGGEGGKRGQGERVVGSRKELRVVEGKEERIEGCGRGIEGGGLKKRFEGGREK